MIDSEWSGKKLHVGCGRKDIPGFINLDLIPFPHVDFVGYAHDLSQFADCSLSMIYASHVLEYYDWEDAEKCLREWKRTLIPGGLIRLAVPNFTALIEVYQSTGSLAAVIGPLYGRIESVQGMAYHKSVFDRHTLENLLIRVGLTQIHSWNWQEVDHGDYDDCSQAYFPHMDKVNGLHVSLNLQASKP